MRRPTRSLQVGFTTMALLLTMWSGLAGARSADTPLQLSQPHTLKWRYASDQTTNFTPAHDGKTVFVPLAGGTLLALNVMNGQLRWKAEAGGEVSAAPAVDEQIVYVATEFPGSENTGTRGTLRALSKETGITLWLKTLQAPIRGNLIAGPTALYAGATNGSVYAFDKTTGRSIWVNQYADGFASEPTLTGGRLYIGSIGGWLLALNQATGDLLWSYRARGPIQGSIAVTTDGVYFGSGDGYVYAFNEKKKKPRWKRRTGAGVQAVVASEHGVLASSLDNFAYLLSKNGSVLWRQLLPGRVPARPLMAVDGALFTPLSTDSAIVLSLKNGKPLNTMPIGEENSNSAAPIAANEMIVLTTPHAVLAFSGAAAKALNKIK
ncbi:MAG TPA: PQQ-binding-like beta-propeller repeat protein [Pyrinomonadaceae bacterium]|nr:PQQ-binding-like beta-propeller repeat protein [Pyrinomonadaceae bacterium]